VSSTIEHTEDSVCWMLLHWHKGERNTRIPRFTPIGWWECDVFEMTDADRWREYEVKLSLADFRADAKKDRMVKGSFRWEGKNGVSDRQTKHSLLAAGSKGGPNHFSFVVPEGLVPLTILPAWAGLVEIVTDNNGAHHLVTKVEPPKLHNEKAHPSIRLHALTCCYHRMRAAWDSLRYKQMLTLTSEPVMIVE
jgi:hypothetical protein